MTTTRSAQVDLDQHTVGEVMREGVVGCAPGTPLEEVAQLMSDNRIHCVIVGSLREDLAGTPPFWGVVSDLDLARAVGSGQQVTAGQVAATELLTATPSDALTDVARMMGDHDVAHLVVVSNAVPIGVISTLDVARAFAGA
jgi:CBS domain-containing protein